MRYLTAIIFASIATAVVFFYALPHYQKIAQIKADEATIQSYINDAADAQSRIDKLEAQVKTFPQDASDRMALMIPDSFDDVLLTMQLTDLATSDGLSVANPSIRKLAVDPASKLQQYDVSFSFEAPYATFRTFLSHIEYYLQLRDITSLSITPGDSLAAPMKVSMEFVTYALH